MCAHTDSQNGIFTRRVYSTYIFDSRHPPLYPQVDGGGCYREKFFLIFIFLIFARNLRMSVLKLFFLFFLWLRSYSDSYSILFRISVVLTHYKFSLGIPYQLLSFLVLCSFDYDFGFTSYRWELRLRYNFSISHFRF